jgi:peptide/nickel transport system substrate-binding protein
MEPIINQTVIVDEFTIKFVLNGPYAPFRALLCFTGSMILSPKSTPADDYLSLSDILVGTGPFKYVEYVADDHVKFTAFEEYYRGPAAIKTMIWNVIEDPDARNSALLSGDINAIDSPDPSYLTQIKNTSSLLLEEGGQRTIIQYLGMNNKAITKIYRQAINYAINYTYVLKEIMQDNAVRMTSPIPLGIQNHNANLKVPTYDLTTARKYLIDAGLSKGLTASSTDAEWIAKAASSDPVANFNFTFNTGNSVRDQIGTLLVDNLKHIGINVVKAGLTWATYINILYGIGGHSKDELGMFAIGWQPDYNDPSNYINPLFSNSSGSNEAQINDPYLQAKMMQAIRVTDPTQRQALYNDIQKYIVEDLMPWALFYVSKARDAHSVDLTQFQQNAMGKVYFYVCCWKGHCPQINEEAGAPPRFIDGFSPIVFGLISMVTVIAIFKRKQH